MGRPAGSKNKSKTFEFNHTNDASQFSMTKEQYDMENLKGNVKKIKVNWETLAKQLQQALAKEIKENDDLKKEVERLRISVIKMGGVIEFLEIKQKSC